MSSGLWDDVALAAAVPADARAALTAIAGGLDALAALDAHDLGVDAAAGLLVELRRHADRAKALTLTLLPVVEDDGLWALDGIRTFSRWVAHRTGAPLAAARREARVGAVLRDDLPRTRAAVVTGALSTDHAAVLVAHAATSDARRQRLASGDGLDEEWLLGQARMLDPDRFRVVVRRWAAAVDPDADDRGYREAADREFLELSRTVGGFHLAGFLTEEHGQALTTALGSVTGVPAAGDGRTVTQRRAAALVDLARAALDHGRTGAHAAVRPHLSVLVQYADVERLARLGSVRPVVASDDMSRGRSGGSPPDTCPEHPPDAAEPAASAVRPGVATFEDGAPLPPSVFARLACDSEVTRIVFGPPGVVLDVGRKQRTVTNQLRRAVVARDRHCRYPGCCAPPAQSEVHHPHHWADGGRTSVENAVLLCWFHHDWVHRHAITVVMRDGTWQLTDRHGSPVTAPDDTLAGRGRPDAGAAAAAGGGVTEQAA